MHDYAVKLRAAERAVEQPAPQHAEPPPQMAPPPMYEAREAPRGPAVDSDAYEQSQVAAAGAGGRGPTTHKVRAGAVDDDHFGDVELDDDLLPT